VDNHDVSEGTEQVLQYYMVRNGLENTKVRINQYDPAGEWRRLVDNKSVAWPWRYSFGTLGWLGYTVLPDGIFGGDRYNPFTDTINVYSDVPALALQEAARAKDFSERQYKGTYAFVTGLPFVDLGHEAQATSDVLSFLQEEGDVASMKEAYDVLYPHNGAIAGDELLGCDLLGAIPGHVIGRAKAASLRDAGPNHVQLSDTLGPPAWQPANHQDTLTGWSELAERPHAAQGEWRNEGRHSTGY